MKDTDRDGLSDRAEVRRFGTNPLLFDTDGDGMGDGLEVLLGRNPLRPEPATPPPDTTAPDTTIGSGPSGSVASGSASFSFSSTETGSTFECRLDSAGWTACSSPQSYSGLANGTHSFAVRARDQAGNTDATPATRDWTVNVPPPPPPPDIQPPSVPTGLSVTSPTETSLTLSWAPSTDNVGVTGYSYFLGSNSVGTTTSTSAVLSGLTCGTTYTLGVSAFDAAGNTSARPTISSTTAACPPPASPAEPGPIAGMGYRQTFRDEFDTLNRAVWDDHIWYEGAPAANSQYVRDGVLNLVARRLQGYQKTTVTTQTAGLTFKYGYFEARMRWTKGAGSWPGFWLYSYRHATNPSWPSVNPECSRLGEPVAQCYSGELDIFEGQGREPNIFYGTLHRNSCSCYGVGNQQTSPNTTNAGFDMTLDFHTYGMLWTPTRVTWFLDGKPLHSANPYDSLNQPMFVLLQMWIGGWTGGTDSSTPDELRTEVDYVRVWQK